MKQLHLLMCILLLLSSFLVILSNNPVESVLYLILTFCNAGTILFLFNLEFFGLIFIIIYVGAIAVLFLFVVMMINIKQEINSFFNSTTNIFLFAVLSLITYILLINLYLCLFTAVPNLQNIDIFPDTIFNTTIDNLNNIDVFGQVLYNFYLFYVPIAGFLLLIALIGSIVLTLNFNKQKKQTFSYKQLARTDNFISFFSNKDIKK
jgi:NADH-quinone oxidoreductase subunit J